MRVNDRTGWVIVLSLITLVGCAHTNTSKFSALPATITASERKPNYAPDSCPVQEGLKIEDLFHSPSWEVVSFSELENFDTLWAISDIHGNLENTQLVLVQAGLAVPSKKQSERVTWNRSKKRQLVIVTGDMIDDGPHSVGVVLFLERFAREAQHNDSRVILILGNHETRFLANAPFKQNEKKIEQILLDDANDPKNGHRSELEAFKPKICEKIENSLSREPYINPRELFNSPFGCYLASQPIGAIVGDLLFAHSGYIDIEKRKGTSLAEFLKYMNDDYKTGNFSQLGDDENPLSSMITKHNWTRKSAQNMKHKLSCLGISAMAMGHDPNDSGEIEVNKDGWLITLDSGAKKFKNEERSQKNKIAFHKGRILGCEINKLFQTNSASPSLSWKNNAGFISCRQFGRTLPVKGKLTRDELSTLKQDKSGDSLREF